jgi:hypothetical protein
MGRYIDEDEQYSRILTNLKHYTYEKVFFSNRSDNYHYLIHIM